MSRPMKSSGVEWIGEIPAGWDVARGKYLFIKKSHPIRDLDDILTCFRDGQATLRKNRRLDGFTVAVKELGYQGVRKGDLVIHAMDAFAGAIGISDSDGKCSPVYSICKARNTLQTYLPFYAYLLRDMAQNGYIQSVAKGIRERSTDFRFSEVEKAFFSLPPLDEQRRIAAYLDRQTSLIDRRVALIGKKRRLLAEARKAIIHEAVTKGLDKGVAIKDSGVEWIGEIPAGWELGRLKDFFTENDRSQPNGMVLSLSYGRIIEKDFSAKKGVSPESFASYQGVHPGDIVLRLTDLQNDHKSLRVGYSDKHGIITSAYLCVRGNGLNPKYSAYLLHDIGDIQKIFYGLGGGVRQSMKFSDLAKLLIPNIPLNEQSRIADFLDKTTAKLDKQIELLGKMEELLKEQRKAIIHEAVTGKIDLSAYEPTNDGVEIAQNDRAESIDCAGEVADSDAEMLDASEEESASDRE